MTMDPQHPLDERLAAYADGDADVLTDGRFARTSPRASAARSSFATSAALRGALADLPDLVPSRPLRFVPPVEAAAADRAASRGSLRRLFAPALVRGRRAGGRRQRGDGRADGDRVLAGKAGAAAGRPRTLSSDSSTEGVDGAARALRP